MIRGKIPRELQRLGIEVDAYEADALVECRLAPQSLGDIKEVTRDAARHREH
jgi:hypothetical protein